MKRLAADDVVGVDLGKTHCRATLFRGQLSRATAASPGQPGLSVAGTETAIVDSIMSLLHELQATAGGFTSIGIGAAGALTAPETAQWLATELARQTSLPVAVASDAITAHVGALGGAPGTTLVAGTGAVAIGISSSASHPLRMVDGWGPDLGDLGSGSWIGRHGIRAALMDKAGIGPTTRLTTELFAHIAPATDPVLWVNNATNRARTIASFAPIVLDAARDGDNIAGTVASQAIDHLVTTARAACLDSPADDQSIPVACFGGLTNHEWFSSRLLIALEAHKLRPVRPIADASMGAHIIALQFDLPHERFIHRA